MTRMKMTRMKMTRMKMKMTITMITESQNEATISTLIER